MRVQIVLTCFTIVVSSIFLMNIGNLAFAIEYEKCGVTVQYPEGWKAENDDYQAEKLRSFVNLYPDPNDFSNLISIKIWDISDYRQKTIEYVSEIFALPDSGGGIEITPIRNDITQVGGFPAQKAAYSDEFKGFKTYFMEINILAYDKVYQISLEAEKQEKFDQYSPIVEDIANSIKISKPNFEGINC